MESTPKKCEEVGCNYAAKFGDTVERTRRFCARHKLNGMLSYEELVRDMGGAATEIRYGKRQTRLLTARC